MKIAVCGSMVFHKEFEELKSQLDSMGHNTHIPELKLGMTDGNISIRDYLATEAKPGEDLTWLWKKKNIAILDHFRIIEDSDCILVANYEKKGIPGYIGVNTMLEMGLATYYGKPIYLLDNVPSEIDWMDEIYGMMPSVINFDLKKII
ncbi:MAG TPA: hypothetical protein PKC14_01205 [Candidatus Absconditabacterales bacterium]|nr:hypothetical protein [Candidatus Absconditabacterales bacterium]